MTTTTPAPAVTASSPLLLQPGAVAGTGVDAAVAGHHGDPLREQRRMLNGKPWLVDRSHRGVITVTGPDRLSWLHSLLSQHVSHLAVGESREALLLSPHGHVEQHLVLTDDGERTWIDLEPGQAESFAGYLESMKFMLRVEVADVSSQFAVVTLGAGLVVADAVLRREMPWGTDLIVPLESLRMLGSEPLVGHAAFEAIRVEARRPRFGFETDHRTIPHEVNWLTTAVHLNKGCYRGQETVARVHNLGKPPRRLVLLHFDGTSEQLPPPGTAVSTTERSVGFLGTTAWHAELGPIGLAVIKRQIADDAQLIVEGMAAAIDPS